ncbi:MAG: hypothetical protein CMK74_01405 [Pseudomonadales bacterium]|nr:hypothetical protein [Pseudomonadales bacterium]
MNVIRGLRSVLKSLLSTQARRIALLGRELELGIFRTMKPGWLDMESMKGLKSGPVYRPLFFA